MKQMIMTMATVAGLAVAGPALADTISEVEGARAHDRQGSYLTRQEREKLRRYGGNDDGFYSGRRGYGWRSGPSVYAAPGYNGYGYGYGYSSPYYGPYGY